MSSVGQNHEVSGSARFGIGTVDFETTKPDPNVLESIPKDLAIRYQVLAVREERESLVVAISDVSQLSAVDDISVLLGRNLIPVLGDPAFIKQRIEDRYIEGMLQDVPSDESQSSALEIGDENDLADLQRMAGEAATVQMVNLMFAQAVRDGVSDIHVEPYEKHVKIRFRIDGLLHEVMSPPKRMHAALISRLKILAELNIAERRLPQDGRIKLNIAGRQVDVRVSIVPTVQGERAVMRILDTTNATLGLVQLGMRPDYLTTFRKLINVPYGMILVTGPTGSGKSTTLYAALQEIYSPKRNILTIEDPVEYQIGGIGQIQVRANIGLTFANGLRSIVRQDPDVIMVGEIRDHETAEIAIHAALTGHLVFSTLHTNDAPSAITRLLDMGVEAYLAASSIVGVLAQRLIRVNCPFCSIHVMESEDALAAVGITSKDFDSANPPFKAGQGCEKCGGSGFKGRRGIYELLTIDETIRRHTVDRVPATVIRDHAIETQNMRTLLGDGRLAILDGISTCDEVLRVCQREDI